MSEDSNKRVAKNAIALTFRMVIATIVGLYTSRIVVEALGLSDYGIYGIIGGVVGMASFLNSAMAGATSRFITFAIGKGDIKEARDAFSAALIIHILIALAVALLAETIGLWFVNNKMNFPKDSMFAVNVLYQFTIVSMMMSFTQIPYSADIVAREKMSIYAYFELLNIILKLLIVYVLFLFQHNRLIIYAALTLAVSLISLCFYRWYCIKNFEEAHFTREINKPLLKKMLSFSGYDLYGNMCVIAKNQGQPIILNLFFGVVANAAASLALTINGTLVGFSSNITTAFKPQIVKSYASGDLYKMVDTLRRSSTFTLTVFGILSIPFLIVPESIVYLWLGKVPQYIIPILRLTIIASIIDSITRINNSAIHSTGDIRNISFISGNLYLLCPILSYLILKLGYLSVIVIYLINALTLCVVVALGWYFIHKQIPNAKCGPYISSTIKSLIALSVSLGATYLYKIYFFTAFSSDLIGKITWILSVVVMGILTFSPIIYFGVFKESERVFIKTKILTLRNRLFKHHV